MPYKSNTELPKQITGLPEKAQTMWRKTFNSAEAIYGEDRARKIAWSSVKRQYKKDEKGVWVLKEKVQSFISLISYPIQALSKVDIMAMIPVETLEQIKSRDEHPYFQAYSICHEGQSTPKLIGESSKPIYWTRRAIQSIKNIITQGIKFFLGHNEDNSTEDRDALGEIVADKQLEIDGKLHHVVVGYFPDKLKVSNKDICSQEAIWNFVEENGKLYAESIDKLTGIALDNSDNNKPAFSGAKRLATMQAYGTVGKTVEEKQMTYEELKVEVRKMNVHPSQLYTLDEIKADIKFMPVFNENEKLKKQVEEKSEELDRLTNENKTLARKSSISTAKTRLDRLLSSWDVEITDNQKQFMNDNFDTMVDKLEDLSDDGLKTLINNGLEQYKNNAKYYGEKQTQEDNSTEGSATDKKDFTKASNNELLEDDYDAEE